MSADNPSSTDRPAPRCPICSRPGVPEYRPFCSKRCADVDLARWLTGSYAVAGGEDDDEDGGDGHESERSEPAEHSAPPLVRKPPRHRRH